MHSLWRIGDGVCRLKEVVARGGRRTALKICAKRVGVNAFWLDEAARAARAFGSEERRSLVRRFETSLTELSPSHVIELARAPPSQRRRAVELLIREPHTVRELRSLLRRNVMRRTHNRPRRS